MDFGLKGQMNNDIDKSVPNNAAPPPDWGLKAGCVIIYKPCLVKVWSNDT